MKLQTNQLLQTKLFIPALRPQLVMRPRLVDSLRATMCDRGLHTKLVLVSAPAGFGKTTLLNTWVHQEKQAVAWLSVDRDDNDTTRFLAYVISALQTIQPDIGRTTLAGLQSPRLADTNITSSVESVLSTLIDDIIQLPERLVLILDDYHLIETPAIHRALTFLIDHLPSQMLLVISTRTDPPLPLARLRLRGELAELRTSDLSFTPDEVRLFFDRAANHMLSPEDVTQLTERTEGWIAGLQAVALSMLTHRDIATIASPITGSNRHIPDFMVEEVLESQPEHVQSFLMQTAILSHLNQSLCQTVTGRDDAQVILEALEKQNLFNIPLDDKRQWFRYHHLFAESLRTQLHRVYPDQQVELHRRAANWYADQGILNEAVDHALAMQDFALASDLMRRAAGPLLARCEYVTVVNWVETLPAPVVSSQPELGTIYASGLLQTGRVAEAEIQLQIVEETMQSLRAMCWSGETTRAVELSQQALDSLPEEELFLRGVMAMNIAANLADAYGPHDEVSAAIDLLTRSVASSQSTGDRSSALMMLCYVGELETARGQLHLAAEIYRRALRLVDNEVSAKQFLLRTGNAHVGLASILYEWNDLNAAAAHLTAALELLDHGGDIGGLAAAYLQLAHVYAAWGCWVDASATLENARSLAHTSGILWIRGGVAAVDVRLWLQQNQLSSVAHWIDNSGLGADRRIGFRRKEEFFTVVRALIALGHTEETENLLTWLEEVTSCADMRRGLVRTLLLCALAIEEGGDTGEAMRVLQRALSLAEAEGYMRSILDIGAPMAKLLRRAGSYGVSPQYVGNLLDEFGAAADAQIHSSTGTPAPAR